MGAFSLQEKKMKPMLTLKRVQKIIQDMEKEKYGAEYHIQNIKKFHVYQLANSGKCMCLTRYTILLSDGHVLHSLSSYENWKTLDPYSKHIETMTVQKAMEEK